MCGSVEPLFIKFIMKMAEEVMPAIEAQDGEEARGVSARPSEGFLERSEQKSPEGVQRRYDESDEETAHYECAFHILPTITDGEVPGVVEYLKALVTRVGGTITDEEVSGRYDLAYDIVTKVDGVNRRFNAAYFGWIRFTLATAAIPAYDAEVRQKPEILRYLVIRLTREEAQRPFSLFVTRRAQDRPYAENKENEETGNGETGGVLSEEALDRSLEKITAD